MVFDDFSAKELLTLLSLKATTQGDGIYTAVKNFFVEKKEPLNKLASITTDGALVMTDRHTGFITQCRNDSNFPTFLHYHRYRCIIHQQVICAKVIGFDHVITPVWFERQTDKLVKYCISLKTFLISIIVKFDLLFHCNAGCYHAKFCFSSKTRVSDFRKSLEAT